MFLNHDKGLFSQQPQWWMETTLTVYKLKFEVLTMLKDTDQTFQHNLAFYTVFTMKASYCHCPNYTLS